MPMQTQLVWRKAQVVFFSDIENPQVLPKVAHDIAFEITNYLAVHIALPAPLENPAAIHLHAVDASGRKRKNIELVFPEKLSPCTYSRQVAH